MILGQEVIFSDEEVIFCFYETAKRETDDEVMRAFAKWYLECKDVETVLDNYLDKAIELVLEYSSTPLFNALPSIGIYDVSESEFREKCIDLTCVKESYDELLEIYNDIVTQQEAEHAYREMRKMARGKFVGGGFGLGAALKGMATAGLMNAAAGAVHSIGNAIGNVNSDMEAENLKKELYCQKETFVALLVGIQLNISEHFRMYIDFLSQRAGRRIYFEFDEDKSDALFRNAINIPEKRNFLLVEALKMNPWNHDLYEYIFRNFPDEKENIIEIGQEYGIDLKDSIEGNQEDVGVDEL